ncbi:MAG: hypothetical protein HC906_03855 [Bacteroidales bacterium]|nr:hypothetical protein [Bacteroidales bacterium]
MGVILTFTYEGAVIKYLKKYLDKHLTTELEVGKINFSLLKKFPNASVELKNIVAKSSAGLNKRDFRKIDTDTLISAKSLIFEFSLPGILKGNYILKNVGIENGRINLLTDKKGKQILIYGKAGMRKKTVMFRYKFKTLFFQM